MGVNCWSVEQDSLCCGTLSYCGSFTICVYTIFLKKSNVLLFLWHLNYCCLYVHNFFKEE